MLAAQRLSLHAIFFFVGTLRDKPRRTLGCNFRIRSGARSRVHAPPFVSANT